MTVRFETEGALAIITLCRPEVRNAVDGPTAELLAAAFRRFAGDDALDVAILAGEGGTFCAGADLSAVGEGRGNRIDAEGDGPMGPTRMRLEKPVIAAIEGYAVAGGLELALFCDLRVAAEDATLGVFCRRFGVPLIDGGTVRLPRLIGLSRALDLILTGRAVKADEALGMGLVNRVVPKGTALEAAKELARLVASFPRTCMRQDRLAAHEGVGLTEEGALANELQRGLASLAAPELVAGLGKFRGGAGRHGGTV